MHLKSLEVSGFKSFAKKTDLEFSSAITSIVGPNGSGKSNVAEAFRFVLGEQSIKSMRGKRGEDLIFNGSASVARMNRAGVKVVFDNPSINGKRLLPVDYDEVSIERVVHRDGENEYLISGTKVRLRDVIELLAGANVGSSGHHIISQGEADRVLTANPKERRAMIEDALGLRVFQYKKDESRKKLEKTEENRKQVEALRKENAPHLRFLERQVEKLQKAVLLREELAQSYQEYLKREELYLAYASESLAREKEKPEREMRELEERLREARQALSESDGHDAKSDDVLRIETNLREARSVKDTLSRDLGRLEGEIVAEERRKEREEKAIETGGDEVVALRDVRSLADEIEGELRSAEESVDPSHIRTTLKNALTRLRDFIAHIATAKTERVRVENEGLIEELRDKHARIASSIKEAESAERELESQYRALRQEIEGKKDKSREAERAVFEIMTSEAEVRTVLQTLRMQEEQVVRQRGEFERELSEAAALIGEYVGGYKEIRILGDNGDEASTESIVSEKRDVQEGRRRTLEKLKIRLEELGGASAEDIMREYKEVKERDEFLTRELADLEKSAASLKELIVELETKLDAKFHEGIDLISREFNNFFMIMFGGGSGGLTLVEEEKRKKGAALDLDGTGDESEMEEGDTEEGVDVSVNLPNKRVRGLAMLSGGERALTSIALIFAMSQVNPPPFLILDETDAALDEANSRRYGDMIESLSKKSQLILITHNRETMSRAGILYGVTMGSDGISKLLSVKFEEAVAVAK